jgi:hypothetical protein
MYANPSYVPPRSMNAVTWEGRLQFAQDVVEVLSIAREFLAAFTPQELASLPGPCQPPLTLVDIEDVNSYAFELVRHNCADSESAELVQKLAAFFSHAAARIAKLLAYRQREIARHMSV